MVVLRKVECSEKIYSELLPNAEPFTRTKAGGAFPLNRDLIYGDDIIASVSSA